MEHLFANSENPDKIPHHRMMQWLIWVCTLCLCLIKMTLGLYGLFFFLISYKVSFICLAWAAVRSKVVVLLL